MEKPSLYTPVHLKDFDILPPESIMEKGGEWLHLFDPSLLKVADALYEELGPYYVNNWHSGGQLKYCGYRPASCTVGAPKSAHKQGKALDLHFLRISNKEAHAKILEKCGYWYSKGIRRMEAFSATPTWVHIDVIPFNSTIHVFNP